MRVLSMALVLAVCTRTDALDNGLAITPPMGWRGWLLFGEEPSQQKIESIFPAMVSRNRSVDGRPTSLCELGYCSVGLDNGWAHCHLGNASQFNYHYNNGTPAVNTGRFPSMRNMTRAAHALGLTVGWYGNNCGGCNEKSAPEAMYRADVAALRQYGFDGIKLVRPCSRTSVPPPSSSPIARGTLLPPRTDV